MVLFTAVMNLVTERVNKIFIELGYDAMIAYIDDCLIIHKL